MSVCYPLMLKWTTRLKKDIPSYAIRIEVAEGTALQKKLETGLLDAALVYNAEYWPDVQVEHLMDETLIQVASANGVEPYVWVDWGLEFREQHNKALPDKATRTLSFNLGPLALQYLLQCSGTGYFRARVVQSYLDSGALKRVTDAPEFSYPIYLVYPRDNASPILRQAIEILRTVVGEQSDWTQQWSMNTPATKAFG